MELVSSAIVSAAMSVVMDSTLAFVEPGMIRRRWRTNAAEEATATIVTELTETATTVVTDASRQQQLTEAAEETAVTIVIESTEAAEEIAAATAIGTTTNSYQLIKNTLVVAMNIINIMVVAMIIIVARKDGVAAAAELMAVAVGVAAMMETATTKIFQTTIFKIHIQLNQSITKIVIVAMIIINIMIVAMIIILGVRMGLSVATVVASTMAAAMIRINQIITPPDSGVIDPTPNLRSQVPITRSILSPRNTMSIN